MLAALADLWHPPGMTTPTRVLITGASSGIGRATARRLARGGARLAIIGRHAAPLESTADELKRLGAAEVAVLPADVAERGGATAALRSAVTRFGGRDGLVTSAGLAELAPIEDTQPAMVERALRTNALGPAAMVRELWPTLLSQRSGRIVLVSTLGTADPFPGFFAYAASKAAVNSMARSIAVEGAEHGIQGFAVAPGAVETPMLRGLFDEKLVPRSACLEPEEVAVVICACLLGERDGQSGRTIFVGRDDGGVRVWDDAPSKSSL